MQSLTSFYRQYLRQVRRLPHHYLRIFFQIKASDDFRAIRRTPPHKPALRTSKIRRVSRDLRKIEQALGGRHDAFTHILNLAYGRKGKLKWELMEPFTAQPDSPPDPIIPAVPTSHPPVYSPELAALLTASASRISSKSLEPHQLEFPPILSPRANPNSEEAQLLGPLSKRLELNTRWRYFTREWKKVLPPLEVTLRKEDGSISTPADVSSSGSKNIGFQGQRILNSIENIVGPSTLPAPMPRRERPLSEDQLPSDRPTRHPSRWLRRRYQDLLGRIPVLLMIPSAHKLQKPVLHIKLSLNSLSLVGRSSAYRRPHLDPVNLAWLERADVLDQNKRKKVILRSPLYRLS
ncbi:hypothetical protein BDP27DRAFT_1210775 [Rhodocollybia butyracea]|uniref:LYR motif-containing protein Cup1-like N-terminal domain-containing protein n=1 Tax=Rhodocollybia butyracea TaxID=206335 RepID=A0A9P5UEC6_9AGAR|nr:hypothetical protein BDP27DRAFT_1210775 [Rhodocollybia butyracea]